MLGGVVEHVAALAEGGEIVGAVAARVVNQTAAREHDLGNGKARDGAEPGETGLGCLDLPGRGQAAHPPHAPVPPLPVIRVPPSAAAQVRDRSAPLQTDAPKPPIGGGRSCFAARVILLLVGNRFFKCHVLLLRG